MPQVQPPPVQRSENGPAPAGCVHRFAAIGTEWQIRTQRPLTEDTRTKISAVCDDIDRVWSRFLPESLVTQIARAEAGGRFEFPARDRCLFDLYDQLFVATDGAVDLLIGRDLELHCYDADYSLTPDHAGLKARAPDSWRRDVRREDTLLITERPVVIDVGAAGKGHLVDLISGILRDADIEQFLVDGGGDLRHAGPGTVTVGLEHPTRRGRVIGTVPLHGTALCASATTRRTWGEGLHHVLDGRTGRPVSDVVATWAIAADAATADGLATALFVAEPAQLSAFTFSWVRMLADGRVQWSNDFAGQLYL